MLTNDKVQNSPTPHALLIFQAYTAHNTLTSHHTPNSKSISINSFGQQEALSQMQVIQSQPVFSFSFHRESVEHQHQITHRFFNPPPLSGEQAIIK